MSISAGLVGLPNVGKSTLFNALTKSSVPAQNYPFCTIEPHVACTPVPDGRLEKLKSIYNSQNIIDSTVQFVDIAGLVKGAASGEGLGNQFLSNIKEVDLILHVLRCFDDPDITYSGQGQIDPIIDFDIINTELMLKDLESVDKRLAKAAQILKANKNGTQEIKDLNSEILFLENIKSALVNEDFQKVQQVAKSSQVETVPLLSSKKFLIIANLSEDEMQNGTYQNNIYYKKLVEHFGDNLVVPISAKLEQEISNLTDSEKQEIEEVMGQFNSNLDNIIEKTYENLGLITFFTCGPKEIHAWPIPKGITIRQAAGEIHSDLQRGFICAEVFNAQDLINLGSIAKLKDSGKMKTEGQDYIVQDGDIVLIKFNI